MNFTKRKALQIVLRITNMSPKSYKNSTLCGEIHRVNNCTSSEEKLKKVLKKIESIFAENEYSPKMIREKIKEISDRSFEPSSNKIECQEQQKKIPI